jgi:molybdate transport system ATP-binding protein
MGVAVSEMRAASVDAGLLVRVRKQLFEARQPSFTLHADCAVAAGITIVFGASGAGKTTLLDCIAGLQMPDEGTISIGGARLFDSASRVNVPTHRRGVGYLFQSVALFPHMSVERNVQYGLAALDRAERNARSAEILEAFRISASARRRPHEISGGERQRVALARTLVTRPKALLLDEPLTALDAVTKSRIIDDLRAWNQRFRIPILYVTHDREEVFALGEHVIALENGRVIAEGAPQEVLRRPQLESVAQLAGFENIFECTMMSEHPEQGTMTCRIAGSSVDLEAPLTRVRPVQALRVGVRAGDILVATSMPQGLSARNIIAGAVRTLGQRDLTVIARVDCGAEFEVHLTPGAVHSLGLAIGTQVWLVIKTYSCHVLQ